MTQSEALDTPHALKVLIEVLEFNGVRYRIDDAARSAPSVSVFLNGNWRSFQVKPRRNVPLSSVVQDKASLFAFPAVTPDQQANLVRNGHSYLDVTQKKLRLLGEQYSIPTTFRGQASPRGKALPGILRALAVQQSWPTQRALADEIGVSQQAISKVLRILKDEFGLSKDSYDQAGILRSFDQVNDARPVLELGYGSLAHPLDEKENLGAYLNELDVEWAFTGVLAADLYAPWSLPNRLEIMCSETIDLEALGFYRTERDPRIHLLVTPETTAYRQASVDGTGHRYSDPLTTWAFLRQRGEADDQQAAEHLEEWLLSGRANLRIDPTVTS